MKRLSANVVVVMALGLMILTGCQQKTQTGSEEMMELDRETQGPGVKRVEIRDGQPAPSRRKKQQKTVFEDLFGPYGDSGRVTEGQQASFGDQNFTSMKMMPAEVVVLEKIAPKSVHAGESFTYTINVYNTADFPVYDVKVTEYPASGFSVSKASPSASGNPMTWTFDKIDAKDSVTIKIDGMTEAEGTLKNCATVTFTPRVCVSSTVVKPELEITKMYGVPEKGVDFANNIDTLLCEPVTVVYTVSNPGSGTLTDVQVNDELPSGVQTLDGSNKVSFTVDTLGPGQTRKFQAKVKATRSGDYSSPAVATSGNMTSQDVASFNVTQPVLAISKSGLAEQFAGRNVTYAISVKNNGTAPAENLIVTDAIDSSSTFVRATDNGTFSNGKVTWNIGTLPVGGTKTVNVTVEPQIKGTISNTATATAVCADAVSAEATTKISGIPAILLEVIDIEDPIEVGDTVTYQIQVTNQGSAQDTNILIVAELEPEMEYVTSSGPTEANVTGRRIEFGPLPDLEPGEKATWRMNVKAAAPGDVRILVTMDSDMITRPVMETEATNFYTTPE